MPHKYYTVLIKAINSENQEGNTPKYNVYLKDDIVCAEDIVCRRERAYKWNTKMQHFQSI